MASMNETIINFAVYEDATEFLGMSEATLPDLSFLTQEISGAGIAGNIESVIICHMEAMTLTLNFRTVSKSQMKLAAPKVHNIDLRVAQQDHDTTAGALKTTGVKHVLKVTPKKTALGKVAPASTADGSGEYAVSYYAVYIDGVKNTEIDPLNFICIIDGVDYLKEVRKILGK